MKDLLCVIGGIFAVIIFLAIFGLVAATEFVFKETFEKGIVEVDEDLTYKCELTKKSKDIVFKKEELKKLKEKK